MFANGNEANTKHEKKIKKLRTNQLLQPTIDKPRVIIHMTLIQFHADATNVFVKRLNCALTLRNFLRKETISVLETCRRLPADVDDEIRLDASRNLRTSKH